MQQIRLKRFHKKCSLSC